MAYTVTCETCGETPPNPACPTCRRSGATGTRTAGRQAPAPVDRREPARQRPIPGGTRRYDPRLAPGQDPPLTTRDCADWMGLTTEFIRGAIDEGVSVHGHQVHLGAETVTLNRRRIHRIHLDDFVTFLQAIGWKRIPRRTA